MWFDYFTGPENIKKERRAGLFATLFGVAVGVCCVIAPVILPIVLAWAGFCAALFATYWLYDNKQRRAQTAARGASHEANGSDFQSSHWAVSYSLLRAQNPSGVSLPFSGFTAFSGSGHRLGEVSPGFKEQKIAMFVSVMAIYCVLQEMYRQQQLAAVSSFVASHSRLTAFPGEKRMPGEGAASSACLKRPA